MQKTLTIIRYLIVIVIVVTLIGLAAWYFFLKAQTDVTTSQSAARGFGATIPSFIGSGGSTYQNVAITAVDSSTAGRGTATATALPPELWHITQGPVAGMGFVSNGVAAPRLYFVERASGNVFSVNLKTGVIDRITNTLFPKIYTASFTRDGAVIERSVDVGGKTTAFAGYVVPQKKPSTTSATSSSPGMLAGAYLDQNILSLAVNPIAREVFYILNDPNAGVIGIRSAWDGTKQKRIFESGIAGWRMYWLSDGRIVLSQEPAYNVGGYAYALKNGLLTPLVRNILGLTIVPRASSTAIVYGTAANNTLALYAQNGTGERVLLPVKTTADKCVWAPSKQLIVYCAVPQSLGVGDFIDPWLQGRIHTSDVWWKINAVDGTAEILFASENSSVNSIDVVRPAIDTGGHYLAFMNGVDASLWVLRIPDNQVATSTTSHSVSL